MLALTAVMGTIGLLGPVSQLVALDDAISSVVLLVGLAVGVDYCMFYLRREMEERDAGKGPEAALEAAAATSGRAVLISGLTVMVAMAGMFLAGNAVFVSFGVGTILVVAVAVLGSLTVLPAMLSWLGEKGWTEKGRVPWLGGLRHRNHGESRVWGAILDRVLARPVVSVVLSTGVLLILALPAVGMHTINPGVAGLPRSLPIMKTYDRIQAAFPGGPLPAEVVVRADDVRAPEVQAGIAKLRQVAAKSDDFGRPVTVETNPRHDLAIVEPADGGRRDRQALGGGARQPARLRAPADARPRARRQDRRDRHDRRLEGLQRHDQVAPADRVRVRPRPRVHPPARHVPVDRDPDQGDRAQPAVGRRRATASSRSSSRTGTSRACSASTRSAASRRGCRCSCS